MEFGTACASQELIAAIHCQLTQLTVCVFLVDYDAHAQFRKRDHPKVLSPVVARSLIIFQYPRDKVDMSC